MTSEKIGALVCDILSFKADNESFLPELRTFTEADWNTLLAFSYRHKLTPLLYSKLLKYKNEPSVLKSRIDSLQGEYMGFAAKYTMLRHEIRSLLKILNGNKIGVILLKGAYIAEKFYENPALRPMCDIDILIRKKDIDRCLNILTENGYKIKNIEEAAGQRQLHCPGVLTKSGILIEPHWDISPSLIFSWKSPTNTSQLWENAIKEELFGMEITALPLESLIVHLCTKIFADNFGGQLLQLYDVALILQKSNVNWELLFSTASTDWDSAKEVYCVLHLAKALFHANVPDSVLAGFKPDGFGYAQADFMRKQLFGIQTLPGNEQSCAMQRICGQSFSRYVLKILNWENISLFGEGKGITIQKLKLVFERIKYLAKQYKKVFSFKMFSRNRDTVDFYRWLKK